MLANLGCFGSPICRGCHWPRAQELFNLSSRFRVYGLGWKAITGSCIQVGSGKSVHSFVVMLP